MAAHVAEESLDGEEAAPRRGEGPDEERNRPALRKVPVDHVGPALEHDRAEDDRHEQEEGKACGGVPGQVERTPGGDRDPRARDPRRERDRLGEADSERLEEREVSDLLALWQAIRQPEQYPEDREEDGDLPGLPEPLLDEALTDGTGDRGGDRRDEDAPRRPLGGSANAPPPHAREPGRDEPDDVLPEIRDDRDERAEMQGDIEGFVEVRMGLEVGPLS